MAEDAFNRIAARADLCRLLTACYYQLGPEFAEEQAFASLREAAEQVDPALAELASELNAAFSAQPLLDLQVDYTRLFINPSGPLAAPYESAWRAGRDPAGAQETVDAVVAAYRAGGHDVDDDFRDLPDHIAAELEFVYALIYREARARALGDHADEQQAIGLRRSFVADHLSRWATSFTDAMQASAETTFYRTLAALTARFIASEGS